jgi:hypothetical protein
MKSITEILKSEKFMFFIIGIAISTIGIVFLKFYFPKELDILFYLLIIYLGAIFMQKGIEQ